MLTIRMLGESAIYLHDDHPLLFRTRKAEAIFYYLVAEAKSVDRRMLAEMFWPEMTTANAQKNLRTVLPHLRKDLDDYLQISTNEIAFNQRLLHQIDLYQLRQLATDSSLTEEEKLDQFQQIYRGEFLAAFTITNSVEFEEWLRGQRESAADTAVTLLGQMTERCLKSSNYATGIAAAQTWLKLEPWNEVAHRLCMQMFRQSNQRSAALLQYNRCFDYLAEELGVEPSAETKKLYVQIQRDDLPVANPPQSPKSTTRTSIRNNLPRWLTSFVGRQEESATLQHYLLEKKIPFVSIIGEGGIGKTRLALSAAERMVSQPATTPYRDGIWFVACSSIEAGVSARDQLVIHIGNAIGFHFFGETPIAQQLSAYLSNKALLLIIDNFEHLQDETPFLLSLLQQAHDLQLLVTSRHDLNIQDDHPIHLLGLEISQVAHQDVDHELSQTELDDLLNSGSVKVLLDRLRSEQLGNKINQENGIFAARLCQLLDGNPLALELAATLLQFYDVETLLSELTQNYRLLSSDLMDLPPRQRSIYNTIDYSWRLLPPELADLLARCSTFRGTFRNKDVTAITNGSAQQISKLIKRSLLHIDQQRNLSIHEMVRQFAADKLAEEPEKESLAQRNHCEYYIQQLYSWWHDTESQHSVAYLNPHVDNIYVAWDWAFRNRRFELLCRALFAYTQFHIYTGQIWDVLAKTEEYQRILEQTPPPADSNEYRLFQEMKASFLYVQALFYLRINKFEQSETLFSELKEQIDQHGYDSMSAVVERSFGLFARLKQQLEKSQHHYLCALHHAQQHNQVYIEISIYFSLAAVADQLGCHDQSAQYLQTAYEILKEYPDPTLEGLYHSYFSNVYHAEGRWSEALAGRLKRWLKLAPGSAPRSWNTRQSANFTGRADAMSWQKSTLSGWIRQTAMMFTSPAPIGTPPGSSTSPTSIVPGNSPNRCSFIANWRRTPHKN